MFNFLPLKYQVDIRTASFMLRFISSENTICHLFVSHAALTLNNIYMLLRIYSYLYIDLYPNPLQASEKNSPDKHTTYYQTFIFMFSSKRASLALLFIVNCGYRPYIV